MDPIDGLDSDGFGDDVPNLPPPPPPPPGEEPPEQPPQQQPSSSSQPAADAATDAAAAVELLSMLRGLPAVYDAAPVLWPPRALRQQVGSQLAALLQRAAATAAAPKHDTTAELAQLLCKHGPQLLLRPPPEVDDPDGSTWGQAGRGAKVTTTIRARLQLARQGSWLELARRLRDDYEASLRRRRDDARQRPPGAQQAEPELSRAEAQAAATRARTGSTKGAAGILTRGPAVPPGEGTDEAVRALFQTEERTANDEQELRGLLAKAMATPARKKLAVTLKLVGGQAAAIRPAAGPGGSGWRNSYIQAVYAAPAGPQALQQWAGAWASGQVARWVAELWTPAIARPFFKNADCRAVRPVLCCEALLKFAMGVCVRGSGKQTAAGVGDFQFGAGREGGAHAEIAQVRAAARAFPGRAFISLDVKNAFGAVEWARALRAVLRRAPQLAAPLAACWQPGCVLVYTQLPQEAEVNGWHCFAIYGSLVQGNCEAHIVFCLVMADVHADLFGDPAPDWLLQAAKVWIYVDDWILQVATQHAALLFEHVRRAFATAKLPLQLAKCSYCVLEEHSPNADHEPEATPGCATVLRQGRQRIPDLDEHISCSQEITLLGTEACRDQEVPLLHDPSDAVPRQTLDRLRAARHLAERTLEMVSLAPPAGAKQAAFNVARCIVAHALDYDAGVLPSSSLLPHAEVLDRAVLDVVCATLDCRADELPQPARSQLQLPASLGGVHLVLPSHVVPLARAARIMEGGPKLRTAVAAWAAEATEEGEDERPAGRRPVPSSLDGADELEADGTMMLLRERGIHGIGGTGEAAQQSVSDPWRPPAPPRHLLSKLLRAAAASAFRTLFTASSDEDRVRLSSASGPTAGSSMVAPLSYHGVHYSDRQWTAALRLRLGMSMPGAPSPCRNEDMAGDRCNEPLDDDHVFECPRGPLRTQKHDELADAYADILDEAGGIARREAFIQELSSKREAWLDVWAMGIPELPDLLLDVTVRHPRASRYFQEALRKPGAAAAHAEREKTEKYPAVPGAAVWPLVHETWGRLGDRAEELLAIAAAASARRAMRRGRVPGNELRRWRARLDGILQRGAADQLHGAKHGLPGKRPCRRRPLDLSQLEASCRCG